MVNTLFMKCTLEIQICSPSPHYVLQHESSKNLSKYSFLRSMKLKVNFFLSRLTDFGKYQCGHKLWPNGYIPEIRFSGICNQLKNGLKASLTRFFFIFVPTFCHIWWFFKVPQCLRRSPLWKVIKNSKNVAKNEDKSCSTHIYYSRPRRKTQNPVYYYQE